MPCTVLIILQTGSLMLLFTDSLNFYGTTAVQIYLVFMKCCWVQLVSLYKYVRSNFAGIDTPGNFLKQETVENNSVMLNVQYCRKTKFMINHIFSSVSVSLSRRLKSMVQLSRHKRRTVYINMQIISKLFSWWYQRQSGIERRS